MFRGKKYQESAKQIDKNALYDTNEAMELLVKTAPAKFDETVELHVKLGVDSRHADQQVRGAIVLPHGTGKTQRVLVFAKAAKADEARAAGADFVGDMDLVEKIQKENWFDFDVVVATPDMMGVVGRLGKVLGPKGLMPSPKAGTVTMDVTKASTRSRPVRWSTVWTRPTSSTAPLARSPSVRRSWLRTSTPSWARSSRPSPPLPRVSISRAAWWLPPWAPASRSTAPSWCNLIPIRLKYVPGPFGPGTIASLYFNKTPVFSSSATGIGSLCSQSRCKKAGPSCKFQHILIDEVLRFCYGKCRKNVQYAEGWLLCGAFVTQSSREVTI